MRQSHRSCAFPRLSTVVFAWALALAPAAAQAPGSEGDAAAGTASAPLPEILEAVRDLHPGDSAYTVRGRSATIGHLTLQLDDGTLIPVVARDGSTVGIWYRGAGHYRYTSEDPSDLQVLRDNLRREASAALWQEGGVADELRELVVFFAPPLWPELWEPEAMTPEERASARATGMEDRRGFERIWGRVVATDLEYDHYAAEARLNGGTAQFVHAEIEGKRDTLGYSYDTVRSYLERLLFFRKYGGVDVRVTDELSRQWIDGGASAHPPTVALTGARIDVSTEDNKSGRIQSDLELIAGRDGVRVVPLLLMNNRNPYSWDWASTKQQLRILRVTDGEGRELPYSHRYHEVLVELPSPLRSGEKLRLSFDTEGEVFTTRFGDRADNYFELFLADWFPQSSFWGAWGAEADEAGEGGGRPAGEIQATLKVRTHKPFRPVASGTVVRFEEGSDSYELETRATQQPAYLAVFAGKYQTREVEAGGRRVRVHAYASAPKRAVETLLGLGSYFLDYYEHVLGPYPQKELDILEIPLWGFGIAPTGLVLLTSEAYNPREDFLSQYFSRGINNRLAHELAHQWFPHKAMPSSSRDNWLSESMAEYMAGLAMAVAQPDERQVAGFRQMHQQWWAEAQYCRDAGPISAAEMLTGDTGYRQRYGLLYNRGPLVLHMLRTYIGDERFFAMLRRYLADAAGRRVTTDDLARAATEVVGEDMSWFFDQWIRHGGIPEFRIEDHVASTEGGGFLLEGTVQHVGGGDFKRIYVPILIEYPDGGKEARFLNVNEPQTAFRYEVAAKPKKVTFDPAHNNLVIYR